MAQFNMFDFQRDAVEDLTAQFKEIWYANSGSGMNITFKSPTGSGKTFMVSNFINGLQSEPDWDEDVAFVWITFSEDLAMQSKDKFFEYFTPNLSNQLLTSVDIASQGILRRNDILFLNWQKLVAKRASDRVLRRPEDDRLHKEQGFYFEDLVERTQNDDRQVIMIIDESHKNYTDAAFDIVVKKLNPKIILNISATPRFEPTVSDIKHKRAGFVEVEREAVVAAGLIKKEIVSQTEEDLCVFQNKDQDHLLLDLAMEKRLALKAEWERIGLNINPLVLIQLPDDERRNAEMGLKTKEEIVTTYLVEKKGVNPAHIAKWFDDKKENMEFIAAPDSPVEFMLFKYAAGTGWDCPRAHIIVMYREIQSDTFRIQTLGRILRNPAPKVDLSGYPSLQIGYLYTNYRRNEVENPMDKGGSNNLPKIYTARPDQKILVDAAVDKFNGDMQDTLFGAIGDNLPTLKKAQEVMPAVSKAVADTASEIAHIAATETDYDKRQAKITEKKQQLEKTVDSQLGNLFADQERAEEIEKLKKDILAKTTEVVDAARGVRDQDIVLDPALLSDSQARADYGDVGRSSDFQFSFIETFGKFFDIDPNDVLDINQQKAKMKAKGIDPTPSLEREVLANARFLSLVGDEENEAGNYVKVEVSDHDVEKEFAWACYNILQEQTEDNAKLGNIARSWSPLKEALRQWFQIAMPSFPGPLAYKIFLKDIAKKEDSVFKRVITKALIEYIPKRDAFIKERERRNAEEAAKPFVMKSQYSYAADYMDFSPSALSYAKPFRLPESYAGRKNEVAFIEFMERHPNRIEWWFKNGTGKEAFGVRYTDASTGKERIFNPDWIIKLKGSNRIAIFDTKGGFTASESEVKAKAEALAFRLKNANDNSKLYSYVGGIVISTEGLWMYSDNDTYTEYEKDKSRWKNFTDLLE